MKKTVPLVLLFAALIYLLPMTALLLPEQAAASASAVQTLPPVPSGSASMPAEPQPPAVSDALPVEEAPLRILDERSGEVREVPVREFVRGAVAAEMPIDYPDEALRAQAVAAHSYALACKAQADPNDPVLKGAYFSANPDQRIGYLTETVMRAMWGDAFEANRARLYSVVDSVLDEVLLYEGQPALACYHAISNGQTESAAAIWGSEVPYLVSVDSMLDLTSPDYEAGAGTGYQHGVSGSGACGGRGELDRRDRADGRRLRAQHFHRRRLLQRNGCAQRPAAAQP